MFICTVYITIQYINIPVIIEPRKNVVYVGQQIGTGTEPGIKLGRGRISFRTLSLLWGLNSAKTVQFFLKKTQKFGSATQKTDQIVCIFWAKLGLKMTTKFKHFQGECREQSNYTVH
jgi:hypothetical protein